MPSTSVHGPAVLQRRLVATDQPLGEPRLGLLDGPSGGALELDRQVGDPAGGDVGGDLDLATADDAEVDHGLPGERVEPVGGRSQVGVLERGHQGVARPPLLDPAEELPDGAEVLDVVDQRGAGEGHQQRPRHPAADPLGDLQHVLGALRLLVLDVVGLVDDHAAEAVVADPADVPVEDLVVDHHHVGEAVDAGAVALDDRHRALRGPHLDLARPVGLDDVGDDAEQRVGVGGLRGEQRLRGLAQAGLVGEQEAAVAVGDRSEQP